MRTKEQATKLSPFWKPKKVGEKVSGIMQGFTSGKFGLNLKLDEKLIPIKFAIATALKKTRDTLKAGKTKVEITFMGQKKGKGVGSFGKVNQYEIKIDGKLIDTTSFETLPVDKGLEMLDALETEQQAERSKRKNKKR